MKISIVTVCFNSQKYIADALASVDHQVNVEREHWIVDGGSQDGTQAIVERYAQPWRHMASEPDRGMYDAMNKGLKYASGDVVGFLNSDDFYADAHALESVADVFADPAVQVCWADLVYVRADRPEKIVRYWKSSAFRSGSFALGWNPPHPTFFVRRAVVERFGGFDLGYAMGNDVELMARFLERDRVPGHYLPRLLVKMRLGGASNRSASAVVLQNRELLRAFDHLGLRSSMALLVGGKIFSRGWQFLARPVRS